MGSPASAGIVPKREPKYGFSKRFPRERGDSVVEDALIEAVYTVPPRARG